HPPRSTLFPYTTLFRSDNIAKGNRTGRIIRIDSGISPKISRLSDRQPADDAVVAQFDGRGPAGDGADRHPKGCDASRCASGDIVHLHARSRSADPERGAAAKQRLVVV